jgi:ATP-dependent Clp protease protease subunit
MLEFTIKTFDSKIHNIYLKGDVDEEMWQSLVDKVNEIKTADDDVADQNLATLMSVGIEAQIIRPSINIYLQTYGGYIYEMLAIYDEIKKLTKDYVVNIYCVGKIMSAGTIIMLAVDYENRFAYPNTTFMYHTLSSFTSGKLKDMEENVEEDKRLHKIMWNIIKENTSIPDDKLEEIYKCKKDWYITAEQAKKYKIISKIL